VKTTDGGFGKSVWRRGRGYLTRIERKTTGTFLKRSPAVSGGALLFGKSLNGHPRAIYMDMKIHQMDDLVRTPQNSRIIELRKWRISRRCFRVPSPSSPSLRGFFCCPGCDLCDKHPHRCSRRFKGPQACEQRSFHCPSSRSSSCVSRHQSSLGLASKSNRKHNIGGTDRRLPHYRAHQASLETRLNPPQLWSRPHPSVAIGGLPTGPIHERQTRTAARSLRRYVGSALRSRLLTGGAVSQH
jgi:hypothetical protein